MTARTFDPRRLDVAAFAKEAATLEGRWPVSQLGRLAEVTVADAAPPDDVTWHARGERRTLRGGDSQVWLHLNTSTRVSLECQRCLEPVAVSVGVERQFLFVAGEDAAAQLDAESDDDVLALSRAFDLRELIEDELLLALPLVPRHEACPEPLQMAFDEVPEEAEPNPFAALAELKRGGALN